MKKILSLLLMTIPMLLGSCQDNDVQDVSFETELINVDAEAQSVTVYVEANCPWYLSSNSDRAYATSTYGEGNAIIELVVYKNSTYDTGTYTFTLTSEDGSDQATLTIVQDARIKMEISMEGDIPAAGGNYYIHLNTNDMIRCTDIPEWVTHVSSRAVENIDICLECKPNRTGSPRNATIILTGMKEDYPVNIRQESYVPEKAVVKIPEKLVEGLKTYRYAVNLQPVYADWNKLYIEIEEGCKAWFEKESLFLEFSKYGDYTLAVYAGEKLLHRQTISVKPIEPVLNIPDNSTVCVGENMVITDDNCSLRFSNNAMVQLQGDGSYTFIKEGELNIKAINDWSFATKSVQVNVERVVLDIESTRTTTNDGKNYVSILFTARGKDIDEYQFYLTENKGDDTPVELKTGKGAGTSIHTYYYRTPSESVNLSDGDPVDAFLSKYTLHFKAVIGGKTYHYKKSFQ